jgi:hypothetical protein
MQLVVMQNTRDFSKAPDCPAALRNVLPISAARMLAKGQLGSVVR